MLKKPKTSYIIPRKISFLMRRLIRGLYKNGYTTRQISEIVECSSGYVHKICYDISRTQSQAHKIKPIKPSNNPRTSRAHARKIMEAHLGKELKMSEHVHHKDRDYTNNDINNLEVLTASEHAKLHHPKNPIPRGRRPERQKYMKEYRRLFVRR